MSNSELGTEGAQALGAVGASDNETTQPNETQTDNANIPTAPAWEGDTRYFQSGVKAGQLKPPYRDDKPRELNTSAKLFDAAGSVNPQGRTEGAVMPLPPQIKGAKVKGKAKVKEADEALADSVTAAAMYNMLLVGTCKLVSDEYEQSKEVQEATLKAAIEYFERANITLPPWVGLLSVTVLNIGVAFKTPKGRSRLGKMWDSARAWYLTRGK